MTKEAVHGSYLEQMKAEHAGKPMPKHRRALVIGSDRRAHNIGAAIVQRFEDDGFEVLDPPMDEVDVRFAGRVGGGCDSFPGIDTLVLANGYTYMDWIENYLADEARRVIECSQLGSIIATREFVE